MIDDTQDDPEPGSAKWEALCDRCGRCCYEKIEYQGRVFYTRTPCKYLNVKNNSCEIYHRRDTLQPDCARLTPELAVSGVLPPDCPYARRFPQRDRGPKEKS